MQKYKAYVVSTLIATTAALYFAGRHLPAPKRNVVPEIVFTSQERVLKAPQVSTPPIPQVDTKLVKMRERYKDISKRFVKTDLEFMSKKDMNKLEKEVFKNTELIVSRLEIEHGNVH